MILIFKNFDGVLARMEAGHAPKQGDVVRLPEVAEKEFIVQKIVYEYFGKNDRHIAEITVK